MVAELEASGVPSLSFPAFSVPLICICCVGFPSAIPLHLHSVTHIGHLMAISPAYPSLTRKTPYLCCFLKSYNAFSLRHQFNNAFRQIPWFLLAQVFFLRKSRWWWESSEDWRGSEELGMCPVVQGSVLSSVLLFLNSLGWTFISGHLHNSSVLAIYPTIGFHLIP